MPTKRNAPDTGNSPSKRTRLTTEQEPVSPPPVRRSPRKARTAAPVTVSAIPENLKKDVIKKAAKAQTKVKLEAARSSAKKTKAAKVKSPEPEPEPEKAEEPAKERPSNARSKSRVPGAGASGSGMVAPTARTAGLQHYIGAHVSIAKGVQNAVTNAQRIGANAFAVFLKSQRKWDNPALQESAVTLWQAACAEHGYRPGRHVLPHGSYLVNLASQTPDGLRKSVDSFVDDLRRCERLGVGLYNFHPGNSNGAPKEAACRMIADAVNLAHEKTSSVVPVLETMASNKPTSNVVGGRFEDLAMIIEHVKNKERIGVCIDTCHTFAAGYDIVTRDGFKKTMEEFDRVVGRKYLRAWHLNDSKAPGGSGRDLHANIGTGFIGLQGFWNVMNMDIWGKGVGVYDLPMVLETPTDEGDGEGEGERQEEEGGAAPKKSVKKEEDHSVWAREIKLLESLVGMDPDGDEFKALAKKLSDRGAAQREKMMAPKGKKSSSRAK